MRIAYAQQFTERNLKPSESQQRLKVMQCLLN